MKVLVTGANGFLGRHIVAELLAAGHNPRAMIQPGTDASCYAGSDLELVEADLTDADSLVRAADGADAVVHLAALVQEWGIREWFEEVNVRGTERLLAAAAESGAGKRFLFMSSLAVHSLGDFVESDESAPRNDGGNPYSWSKIRCEDLLAEAHEKGIVSTVIIRPGLIPYGEWDVRGFGALAATISAGFMPVAGDPDALTCTVYAPNLALGVRLALDSAPGELKTYVIADDVKIAWRDYFAALADSLGVPLRLLRVPGVLARTAGSLAEGAWKRFRLPGRPPVTSYLAALMSRNTHFTSTLAADQLRYSPLYTFAEGMERTARWWLSIPSKEG